MAETMTDFEDLKDLKARLARARGERGDTGPGKREGGPGAGQSMGLAYRASAELVVAILVAAFLGYWLDKWLMTSPIFLIILFLFGMATGIRNLLRTVSGVAKDSHDDD